MLKGEAAVVTGSTSGIGLGIARARAARFGAVDILVNNAGIQHTAPVEEFPLEKWEQILAINLSSAFYSIKTALPHMRHTGWGRIINTPTSKTLEFP